MTPSRRLIVPALALLWNLFAVPLAAGGETPRRMEPLKSVFENPSTIIVPDEGPADLYPSTIQVSSFFGPVGTVTVRLNGVSHGRLRDLDLLLVGPSGIKVLLQSDGGGDGALTTATYAFDQAAGMPIAQGTAPGQGLGYRPADYTDGADSFPPPAPPGPYATSLTDFLGSAPNGGWSLYVADDMAGAAGLIANGWTLEITEALRGGWGGPPLDVPDAGPASPYPATLHPFGLPGTIAHVSLWMGSLSHTRPDDLDVLLVGPTGVKVLLQSDAGGDTDASQVLYELTSVAPDVLPDESPLTAFRYRPANYGGGDVFPAPAPPGPYGSSLADFDGTDPNGTWSLYVLDDTPGDAGRIDNWLLVFATTAVPDYFRKGDFNYDYQQDVVWQNGVSGEIVLWSMSDPQFGPGVFLTHGLLTNPPVLDPRWKIVGSHDFNADRRTDLLFRHAESGEMAVWFMNGAALAAGAFTNPPAVADLRWTIAGTGYFDRDGQPDLLWRNTVSGENAVWFMNGVSLRSGALTAPAVREPAWVLAGVADFNRDGLSDILWRHQSSGDLDIWHMDGATVLSAAPPTPSAVPDTDWKVMSLADFAYGWTEVYWRHQSSGQIVRWKMQGSELIEGTFTTPNVVADQSWRLVGPR